MVSWTQFRYLSHRNRATVIYLRFRFLVLMRLRPIGSESILLARFFGNRQYDRDAVIYASRSDKFVFISFSRHHLYP